MQENRKQRRRHSAEFKAQVIEACKEPGASTAGVALAFGVNANLVRQWRRGRGVVRAGLVAPHEESANIRRFVPLSVEEAPAPVVRPPSLECEPSVIDVQLRRGALEVSVRWPVNSGAECARLLRELLK